MAMSAALSRLIWISACAASRWIAICACATSRAGSTLAAGVASARVGGNPFRRLEEQARRLVTQRLGELLRAVGDVLGRHERTVGAAALQGDQLLLQRPTMERWPSACSRLPMPTTSTDSSISSGHCRSELQLKKDAELAR